MQASCALALKAALDLARTGLAVFPCAHNKKPCTPHAFYDASKDAETVQALWCRHVGTLVGIRTGEASGLAVLDVDAKHAAATQWYAENRNRLLPTRAHRTPGGGLHLIFAHVEGLRCSQSRIARGVDVKAEGGYAIWYPAVGLPVLCEGPLAPWPAWLLAQLKPKAPPPPSRLVIPDDRRLQQLRAASQPRTRASAMPWRFGAHAGSPRWSARACSARAMPSHSSSKQPWPPACRARKRSQPHTVECERQCDHGEERQGQAQSGTADRPA